MMSKLIIDTQHLSGSDLLMARYLAALSKYRTRAQLFSDDLNSTGTASRELVDNANAELQAIINAPEFRELQMLHIATAADRYNIAASTIRNICNGHGALANQIDCEKRGHTWYVYGPDIEYLIDTEELVPRTKKDRAT